MAINLQSLIQAELGPDVVGRLASALGTSDAAAQGALRTIVPTMVGALVNRGSTHDGASILLATLRRIDPGVLDDVAGKFREKDFTAFSRQGSDLLPGMFGAKLGPALDELTAVTALDKPALSRVLGALAPIVLAYLRQAVGREQLDALGLANLLDGQRPHLATSLPRTLGDILGLAVAPPRTLSEPTLRVEAPPPRRRSFGGFATAAIGLVLVAFAYAAIRDARSEPGLPDVAADAPVSVVAGFEDTIETLRGALVAVEDEASAKEAVPALIAAEGQIDNLSLGLGVLPHSVRSQLAVRARSFGPTLDEEASRIDEIPAARDLLSPLASKIADGLERIADS